MTGLRPNFLKPFSPSLLSAAFVETGAIEVSASEKEPIQESLSGALQWLNDRAWPLGGGILAISMIYVHNYFHEEGIPLSLVSSTAVTAIPAVFIMLLFVVAVLVGLVMTPTMLLFTSMTKDHEKWLIPKQADGKVNPQVWMKFSRRWLMSLSPLGAILCLVGLLSPGWAKTHPGWWSIASVSAIVIGGCIFLFLVLRHRPDVKLKHITIDFWFVSLCAVLLQLLALTIFAAIAANVASIYVNEIVIFLLLFALGVFGLGLSQLVGIALVRIAIGQGHQLKIAGSVVAFLIVLGAIFPFVSARLVSYSIQVPGPDGKPCAVLIWAHEVTPIDALKNARNMQRSTNVRILAESDDLYFVRPENAKSKAVSLVPRSSVETIGACG